MTTVAATRAAISNRDQYHILLRYARGMELPAIALDTDLALELVAGTVQRIASSNRSFARTLVDEYERTRRATTPTLKVAPATDPPDAPPPVADPLADLLAKAEASGDKRLKVLVGRVRELLADIERRHGRLAEEAAAAAEVTEARAALAAAEARLRNVHRPGAPGTLATATPASVRERYARIRGWAAANGHEVYPTGRIPRPVVVAYEAATGDAG